MVLSRGLKRRLSKPLGPRNKHLRSYTVIGENSLHRLHTSLQAQQPYTRVGALLRNAGNSVSIYYATLRKETVKFPYTYYGTLRKETVKSPLI